MFPQSLLLNLIIALVTLAPVGRQNKLAPVGKNTLKPDEARSGPNKLAPDGPDGTNLRQMGQKQTCPDGGQNKLKIPYSTCLTTIRFIAAG